MKYQLLRHPHVRRKREQEHLFCLVPLPHVETRDWPRHKRFPLNSHHRPFFSHSYPINFFAIPHLSLSSLAQKLFCSLLAQFRRHNAISYLFANGDVEKNIADVAQVGSGPPQHVPHGLDSPLGGLSISAHQQLVELLNCVGAFVAFRLLMSGGIMQRFVIDGSISNLSHIVCHKMTGNNTKWSMQELGNKCDQNVNDFCGLFACVQKKKKKNHSHNFLRSPPSPIMLTRSMTSVTFGFDTSLPNKSMVTRASCQGAPNRLR